MAKFIVIQSRQVSKELHCFGDCFVKQRAVCIINVWGYTEILPVSLWGRNRNAVMSFLKFKMEFFSAKI